MVNTPNDSTQQSQVNTTVTFSEPIENRPRGYLICGSPSSSFSFIPSIISTVSFILSVASLSVCNFYQRDVTFDSSRSEPTATNFLTTTRGIGFFTYAGSGEFGEIVFLPIIRINALFILTCALLIKSFRRPLSTISRLYSKRCFLGNVSSICYSCDSIWWFCNDYALVCGKFIKNNF